jgi:hypothetical protein
LKHCRTATCTTRSPRSTGSAVRIVMPDQPARKMAVGTAGNAVSDVSTAVSRCEENRIPSIFSERLSGPQLHQRQARDHLHVRGASSVGRAPQSHCGGPLRDRSAFQAVPSGAQFQPARNAGSARSEHLVGCNREGNRPGDEKHHNPEHEGIAHHPVAGARDRWFDRASQSP